MTPVQWGGQKYRTRRLSKNFNFEMLATKSMLSPCLPGTHLVAATLGRQKYWKQSDIATERHEVPIIGNPTAPSPQGNPDKTRKNARKKKGRWRQPKQSRNIPTEPGSWGCRCHQRDKCHIYLPVQLSKVHLQATEGSKYKWDTPS